MSTARKLPVILTANDVAEAMRCSLSHAYALMRTMPHTKIGAMLRVTEEDFAAWYKSQERAPCEFTSSEESGGRPGLSTAKPSSDRAGRRTGRRRKYSLENGSENALIRLTQPRPKRA
jgi:hypothetical protein